MIIALFTNDLMFQSRIASVVRNSGGNLIVARDLDTLASRLQTGLAPSSVVFDLSVPGLDLDRIATALRERYPEAKQIAYGPHVDVERLQHAKAIGIDEVLTRGQFDRDMVSFLR
jgi:DNA-binding NarL/FixJ family response regulator